MKPERSNASKKCNHALLEAVARANVGLVRSLIAEGADLNECRPLSAGRFAHTGTVGRTPLGIAIVERQKASGILQGAGAKLTSGELRAKQDYPALLEIMEELARAGADVNLFSTSRAADKSLLYVAASGNDEEAVQLLLRHGARTDGTEALHVAAYQGHIEMVKALLAAGLDANEKVDGLTPLQMLNDLPSRKNESEWVLNLGPEIEEELAKQKKERMARWEQIIPILEAHKTRSPDETDS